MVFLAPSYDDVPKIYPNKSEAVPEPPREPPTNGKVILAIIPQPENAELPMLVTLDGIVTDVRPLQPENAELPMLVTFGGIVSEVSPLQPEKAALPILVTLAGIVTDVRPLQP